MNKYLQKTLEGEKESLIALPMRPECKLAVLVPAFDESVEMALMPLASLAAQAGVGKNEFEVVFIVSNNREHAARKSREFKQNQVLIKFLQYLGETRKNYPVKLNRKQLELVKKIRASGLVVHVIDKSSLASANEYEDANVARNRAGAEICQRFFSVPAGKNGIIAMTDCDCRFSDNYVSELIRTFETPKVNRVAGKLLAEIDNTMPHPELIKQCLLIYSKSTVFFENYIQPKTRLPLLVQRRDNLKYSLPASANNSAVRVSAWLEAGGISPGYSFADLLFTNKVSGLPGDTVYNPNFWVAVLYRVSERVGMVSLGRRIKIISDSLESFIRGKQENFYVPDLQKILALFRQIRSVLEQGPLTLEVLRYYLEFYGAGGADKSDMVNLAALLNVEREGQLNPSGFEEIESLVVSKIYPHLPKIVLSQNKLSVL